MQQKGAYSQPHLVTIHLSLCGRYFDHPVLTCLQFLLLLLPLLFTLLFIFLLTRKMIFRKVSEDTLMLWSDKGVARVQKEMLRRLFPIFF